MPFKFIEIYAIKIALAISLSKENYENGLYRDYSNLKSNIIV
jgi:hypothetical protein